MQILQLLVSGISLGCVYGLIALGFVLIYRTTEMVNFAQGDFMMLGAFVAYSLIELAGLPFGVGVAGTVLGMALLGLVLERLVLRPMIGEPLFAVLMITIGLGLILRTVAVAVWGAETRTLDTPMSGGVLRLGGAESGVGLGHENLAVIAGSALCCAALYLFLRFTRVGVAMQASSQNQKAAYFVGIPVRRMVALAWALAAAIAGLAGLLVAPISLIEPNMGFLGIKAFAAAIVGGFGSLAGAMVGGLLIGVVEQLAGLYLPPALAGVSGYGLLLIVLLVRPEGIFPTLQAKKV
ncbi:MAG: branched-chain amino acid ABC transporter permease [Acidobacteriota bacterium]